MFIHSPQRKIALLVVLLFFLFLFSSPLFANNLTISNAVVTGQDTQAKTAKAQFSLSWDHSWRDNTNFDAVWVFVKYSTDQGATWKHATLKSSGKNPSGFSVGTGTLLDIVVPTDKKGCFIQRAQNGQGSVSTKDIQLVWDWNADGEQPSATVRIKVFGIEMVYIPQSNFYLGDGNAASESAYAFHVADNTAVQVTSAAVANVTVDSNANDDLAASAITVSGTNGITGNTNFPTGYNALYAMKYEITEGQWVDFFNMLSAAQKANRDITNSNGKNSDNAVNRNTIAWTTGDATTSRPDRACGYLSWMDLCAYADWSGLRPMSELEYEKMSRGNRNSVFGEYAWGSIAMTAASAISGTEEDGAETITTANANCCLTSQNFSGGDDGTGPVRAGIFATATSNRLQSGSSYYGVMELSGNLWERTVTVGNSAGRSFSATNGDGVLSTETSYEGNANNSDWPGIDANPLRGVTGATGSGLRGGGWDSASALARVSDRTNSSRTDATRNASYGGRCVRTAP